MTQKSFCMQNYWFRNKYKHNNTKIINNKFITYLFLFKSETVIILSTFKNITDQGKENNNSAISCVHL